MLNKIAAKEKALWFNLAVGRHERNAAGELFCNTKYGLTGIGKAFELMPKLRNFEVISICLTYLRKNRNLSAPAHCPHCVTEDLASAGHPLTSADDLPQFLLHRLKGLLEKKNFPP